MWTYRFCIRVLMSGIYLHMAGLIHPFKNSVHSIHNAHSSFGRSVSQTTTRIIFQWSKTHRAWIVAIFFSPPSNMTRVYFEIHSALCVCPDTAMFLGLYPTHVCKIRTKLRASLQFSIGLLLPFRFWPVWPPPYGIEKNCPKAQLTCRPLLYGIPLNVSPYIVVSSFLSPSHLFNFCMIFAAVVVVVVVVQAVLVLTSPLYTANVWSPPTALVCVCVLLNLSSPQLFLAIDRSSC